MRDYGGKTEQQEVEDQQAMLMIVFGIIVFAVSVVALWLAGGE